MRSEAVRQPLASHGHDHVIPPSHPDREGRTLAKGPSYRSLKKPTLSQFSCSNRSRTSGQRSVESRSRRFSSEVHSTMVCDPEMERSMSTVHSWQRVPSWDGSRQILPQHAVRPAKIERDDVEWTLQATLDAHELPPPVQQPDGDDAQLALKNQVFLDATDLTSQTGASVRTFNTETTLYHSRPATGTFTTSETALNHSRPASGTLNFNADPTSKTEASVEPVAVLTTPTAQAAVASCEGSGGLAAQVAKYIFRGGVKTPGSPETPGSLVTETPPEIPRSASWLKINWQATSPGALLRRCGSVIVKTDPKALVPPPTDCATQSQNQSSPVCGWGDGDASPTSRDGALCAGGLSMQRQGSLWLRRRTRSLRDTTPLKPLRVTPGAEV
eukprot:CAMPEP_0180147208 /NCGR_PEP_ID=MMETSP0986-20121125/19103_1 /TAXON_ID=697907 /ORGANISM="non described non described, Strain CCMP2293" /LENGTH=385 /DNA_ID=CAMNT_0022092681 /DNA_START=44 /DNA_END=1201 /DNA_ORIENTATION=+